MYARISTQMDKEITGKKCMVSRKAPSVRTGHKRAEEQSQEKIVLLHNRSCDTTRRVEEKCNKGMVPVGFIPAMNYMVL